MSQTSAPFDDLAHVGVRILPLAPSRPHLVGACSHLMTSTRRSSPSVAICRRILCAWMFWKAL
jgi:hypothetical protein